jgi:hypothetical protein
MSQKQISKLKDSLELFTLISIFLVSVIAIAPVM